MKLWLKLSISFALLFFIFNKIGFRDVLETVTKAKWIYLIVAILIYIAALVIDSYVFHILLKENKKVPFTQMISLYIYSWSVGMLLPGRTGDLIIIPFLKKRGVTIGESLAAIILNRLTSVILIIIIAFLGVYIFFRDDFLGISLTVILLVSMGLFILFHGKSRLFIEKRILRSYAHYFTGFSKNLKSYFGPKAKLLLLNILLTSFKILIGGFVPFLIFKSLGISIDFFILVIIFNTVTLFSFVPFTLSGLGLRESAIWFLLVKIGIPSEIVGSAILLSIAMTYLLGFVFSIMLKVDYRV